MLEQKLESGPLQARFNIENSQLFSLAFQNEEYMHLGGKPEASDGEKLGWANSEIVMFPIVGPAKNFQIEVGGKNYAMSQHGISRNLPFALSQTSLLGEQLQCIAFTQVYRANTPVLNPKYVVDATAPAEGKELFWPFNYALTKLYELVDGGIRVEFGIKNFSEKPMPYAFGWHPAFKIGDDATLSVDGAFLTLDDVRATGHALKYRAHEVTLATEDRALKVVADTNYFMLWSPEGSKFLCIEPITKRPNTDDPMQLLAPNSEKKYAVQIFLKEKEKRP